MNWEWSFRKIPLRPRQTIVIVMLILLSFWAQSGFTVDRNHLLFFVSNYGFWLFLLPFVNQLSQRIQKSFEPLQFFTMALGLIAIHWIGSNVILYLLRFLVGEHLMLVWEEIRLFLLPSIASRAIDFALFTGLLSWIHQQQVLTTQKVLMAESQTLLERSKLQSLKNQLNPHFLFNALHTINSLIGINDQRASEMIIKMSHLLRSMLAMNELDEHTLREEVEFTRRYLDIEAERFKDRLEVIFKVEDQANTIVIPTMTLQPLVENAFKHGISKMTGQSTLDIHIKLKNDVLTIMVCNDLPDVSQEKTEKGIGLANLSDRLQTYYQHRVKIDISKRTHRFEVLISIMS